MRWERPWLGRTCRPFQIKTVDRASRSHKKENRGLRLGERLDRCETIREEGDGYSNRLDSGAPLQAQSGSDVPLHRYLCPLSRHSEPGFKLACWRSRVADSPSSIEPAPGFRWTSPPTPLPCPLPAQFLGPRSHGRHISVMAHDELCSMRDVSP